METDTGLTWAELQMWIAAFASCAIEGNKVAKHMIDLWNGGKREQFFAELEEMRTCENGV